MHESEVYQRDGGSSIFLLLFGSDAMFGRLLTWKLQEVGVNGRCCYLLVFFFGQDVVWVESLKNERFGMPWVQFCKARSPHEPMGFRLISPCDEKGFFFVKMWWKRLKHWHWIGSWTSRWSPIVKFAVDIFRGVLLTKKNSRGVLLTHSFYHTFHDWLKFMWVSYPI